MVNPSSVFAPCRAGSDVNRSRNIARRLPTPPISKPVRNPPATPEASVAPGEERSRHVSSLHRGTIAHVASRDKLGYPKYFALPGSDRRSENPESDDAPVVVELHAARDHRVSNGDAKLIRIDSDTGKSALRHDCPVAWLTGVRAKPAKMGSGVVKAG
jgi:hypothetical protein